MEAMFAYMSCMHVNVHIQKPIINLVYIASNQTYNGSISRKCFTNILIIFHFHVAVRMQIVQNVLTNLKFKRISELTFCFQTQMTFETQFWTDNMHMQSYSLNNTKNHCDILFILLLCWRVILCSITLKMKFMINFSSKLMLKSLLIFEYLHDLSNL